VAESSADWSPLIHTEADGTCRVEIVDEDGVTYPVARQLTPGQAHRLIERIGDESRTEHKPVKDVIRDPYFMAATVITVKRLPNGR
jgi:hypothetical protein